MGRYTLRRDNAARQRAALLCVALILFAGLIPAAVALVPTPLIQLGAVIADAGASQPVPAEPALRVSLRAMVSSRHFLSLPSCLHVRKRPFPFFESLPAGGSMSLKKCLGKALIYLFDLAPSPACRCAPIKSNNS